MSFNANKPETVSRMECQLVRDFCASAGTLMEQFERFERSRTLSHPALSELLGVPNNRGSMWRLKDAAHILFARADNLPGQLLDRSIGTIFHETIKLMEATYLSQHYVTACKTYILRNFSGGGQGFRVSPPLEGADVLAESADDLLAVLEECSQDVRYGIERLGKILDIARPLLCTCFNGKGGNQMLMKYLDGRKMLVEKVMGRFYQDFLDSLNFNGQNSPAEEPRFSSRFALGK